MVSPHVTSSPAGQDRPQARAKVRLGRHTIGVGSHGQRHSPGGWSFVFVRRLVAPDAQIVLDV